MVQDVDLAVFEALGPGDILFIDSSHVAKVGSDVNHLVFEILPRLSPGVYVHFHDMFYPFEYPEDWILGEGRYWNEDYLLRAFLQFNGSYAIAVWDHFLWLRFGDRIAVSMPRCGPEPRGEPLARTVWLTHDVPSCWLPAASPSPPWPASTAPTGPRRMPAWSLTRKATSAARRSLSSAGATGLGLVFELYQLVLCAMRTQTAALAGLWKPYSAIEFLEVSQCTIWGLF